MQSLYYTSTELENYSQKETQWYSLIHAGITEMYRELYPGNNMYTKGSSEIRHEYRKCIVWYLIDTHLQDTEIRPEGPNNSEC